MIKFMVFIVRRPDMTDDEFEDYFREVHAPLVEALPGLVGYTQNVVRVDRQASDGFAVCDAIAELWFDDREALERAWATPEGQAISADNANFIDLELSAWTVVDEDVVV